MAKHDYISREAAVRAIDVKNIYHGIIEPLQEILRDIPAADVRPVVRGTWMKCMVEKETPYYKSFTPVWSCSECRKEYDPSFCMTINFCPNCGADMREVTSGDTGTKG